MDAVGTRRLYKELDQAARNDPTGLSGVLHSFPKAVLPMGDLRNRHPVILAMPALGGTDISISSCWFVAPHATATIITSCVSRNQPGESARVGYITLTGSVLESSHGSILASAEDLKNDDIEIILVAEQLTRASIVIAAPPGVYASYAELLREYDLFRAHSPDDVDIILQLQSGELDMLIIHNS